MIGEQSRHYFFGASDTRMVLRENHETKTWKQWWAVKLGIVEPEFQGNIYTNAGNKYEHPIMEALGLKEHEMDLTLYVPKYRLRVNYDGIKLTNDGLITEIKTFRGDKEFPYDESVKNGYWQQCQVEMYCYLNAVQNDMLPPMLPTMAVDSRGKPYMIIVGYPLDAEEYFSDKAPEVDVNRLEVHTVYYDKKWIKSVYLPKLKKLARQLKRGIGDEE